MKHSVVLYGKPGCHLCDIAHQLLLGLVREYDFTLEEVDITRDDGLMARYRDTIPVVIIDNRTTLAAPIRTEDLRTALANKSLSRADDLSPSGKLK